MAALVLTVTLVLAALTALRWVDSDSSLLVVALQSLRWVYAVLAVLVLLAAVLLRHRWAVLLAGSLVAVHALVAVPAFVPAAQVAPGTDDLVVLSANLEFGRADPGPVVEAVRRLDVDVLVLLEATAAAERGLSGAGLDELLPESVGQTRDDPGGTLIRSRHRLIAQRVPPSTFGQPSALVQAPGGEVLLRAAHPLAPLDAPTWHAELGDLASWAVGTRQRQDLPVVLAGDLNASEDHPAFRRLTRVMTDAHRERGAGWVRSWPMGAPFPPFCQIDHVLVRGLGVVEVGTVVLPGTDHAAVWSRLSSG